MSHQQLLDATDRLQKRHDHSKLKMTKFKIPIPANTSNLIALSLDIIGKSDSTLEIFPLRENLLPMLTHAQKSKPTTVTVVRAQLDDEIACWVQIEGNEVESDSDPQFFIGCLTVPSEHHSIIMAAAYEMFYTICVEREQAKVEYHFSDAYFGQLTLLTLPWISLLLKERDDEDRAFVTLCFTQRGKQFCGYYDGVIKRVKDAQASHPEHPSATSSHASSTASDSEPTPRPTPKHRRHANDRDATVTLPTRGAGERSKKKISPKPAAKRSASTPNTEKRGSKKSTAPKPVAVPVSRSLVPTKPEPKVRLGDTVALIRRARTIARVARLTHVSAKPTAYTLYRKRNAGKGSVVPWKRLLPETRRKFEDMRVRAQKTSDKKQRIRAEAGFQQFVAAYLSKQDSEFTDSGKFGKMLRKIEKEGGRKKDYKIGKVLFLMYATQQPLRKYFTEKAKRSNYNVLSCITAGRCSTIPPEHIDTSDSSSSSDNSYSDSD